MKYFDLIQKKKLHQFIPIANQSGDHCKWAIQRAWPYIE